ncbi:MAG: tetratricopeptide (TPR) repeat protein [Lentimonas sp.]|jgi:tetratricopeptide (TPR) repeat protein
MKNWLFTLVISIGISALITSCNEKKETIPNKELSIDSLLIMYPDSLEVLIKYSQHYVDQYEYQKALASATKAFRLDSNNLKARYLYADILNNRTERSVEDIMVAQRHFNFVQSKEPKNTAALVSLASTFSFSQNFEKSFEYINEALRIDPKNKNAYVLKGSNYMQLGNTKLAKSSYETATQQDPAFYEAYLFLGNLYQGEANPICLEYFLTAAELQPKNLDVLYSLAYSYQTFQRYEEASQVYRRMFATDSSFAMPLFQQGYIKQFYTNDIDSAVYFYNETIIIQPMFVEAWHNLGMCHEVNNDRPRALSAYARALKYNPNFELSRVAAERLK